MKFHKCVYSHVYLSSSRRGTYRSSYKPYPGWSSLVSSRWSYQSDVPAASLSHSSSLWWVLAARAHCIFPARLAPYFIWSRLATSALPPGRGIRGCWDRTWAITGSSSRSRLSAALASSAGCCISEDSTWTAFEAANKQRGWCRKDPSVLCSCKLATWVSRTDEARRGGGDRGTEGICILVFVRGDKSKGCEVDLRLWEYAAWSLRWNSAAFRGWLYSQWSDHLGRRSILSRVSHQLGWAAGQATVSFD